MHVSAAVVIMESRCDLGIVELLTGRDSLGCRRGLLGVGGDGDPMGLAGPRRDGYDSYGTPMTLWGLK